MGKKTLKNKILVRLNNNKHGVSELKNHSGQEVLLSCLYCTFIHLSLLGLNGLINITLVLFKVSVGLENKSLISQRERWQAQNNP